MDVLSQSPLIFPVYINERGKEIIPACTCRYTHTHTHTHTHPTHTHLCIYEVSFFRDVTSILKKELNYLRKEN